MSLRTAVIGGGAVSEVHLAGLVRNPRTEPVAVCDGDEEVARALAREYELLPYTSTTELLAAEDLDWVHLCTPVPTHYDLAREVVEAGVPLLIEQPVTGTAAEASALADVAAERDVPVSVVRDHLFTSAMREVRAAIDGGELGEVRAVEVTYAGTTWPDDADRGARTLELDGGGFEAAIPHPIYVGLGTAGSPVDEASVDAVTSRDREYDRGFTYDGLKLQYPTAGGTLCGITVLAGSVPQRTVDVHGTDGSLRADLLSGTTMRLTRDYAASPAARLRNDVDRAAGRLRGAVSNVRGGVRARRSDDWTTERDRTPHYSQFDREVDAILGGGAPAVPLENAVWTLRLMEAVRATAAEGAADPEAADLDGQSGGSDGPEDAVPGDPPGQS